MSLQSLTARVAKMQAALRPVIPHRTIVMHEEGSDVYLLSMDGSSVDSAALDRLQAQGHNLLIEDYPTGYFGDVLGPDGTPLSSGKADSNKRRLDGV